jgi:hypothetical protein
VCHNVTRKRPTNEPEEPEGPEKKERVIHTRVPESLEAELRRRAQDLGISVSNLVRNVLGHAFGLVGDVVADSHAIARAARGERKRGRDVVAWQSLVVVKTTACTRCEVLLAKGTPAAISVHEDGSPGAIECLPCTKEAS